MTSTIFIRSFTLSDTYLFVGTADCRICRWPLPEITSVEKYTSEIPSQFELSQYYPNPFNPTTTIVFSLPKRSFVTLKVYDAIGREVSNLVSEELGEGKYSVPWNGKGLASGVYYYRLQAGEFVATKKLLLLR